MRKLRKKKIYIKGVLWMPPQNRKIQASTERFNTRPMLLIARSMLSLYCDEENWASPWAASSERWVINFSACGKWFVKWIFSMSQSYVNAIGNSFGSLFFTFARRIEVPNLWTYFACGSSRKTISRDKIDGRLNLNHSQFYGIKFWIDDLFDFNWDIQRKTT